MESATSNNQPQHFRPFAAVALFPYDDSGRLLSQRDVRGTNWQYAYSQKNERLHMRQSDVPYGPGDSESPEYFVDYTYNDFSEIISKNEHGIIQTDIQRLGDGRVASVSSTGAGTTYYSFDTDGNVVWQQSPHYDVQLTTQNPFDSTAMPRISQVSIARPLDGEFYDQNGPALPTEFLTRTSVTYMNENYEPIRREQSSNDGELSVQYWTRTASGFVSSFTNPEGSLCNFNYNLLGWTTQFQIESDSGFAVTSNTYNSRGQRLQVIDPSGQNTSWEYDKLGRMTSETRPGSSNLFSQLEYDKLGRVAMHQNANDEVLTYSYHPQKGDLIGERWGNSPVGSQNLKYYSYDILGRVSSTFNNNVSVMNTRTVNSEVGVTYDYDPLGRVIREGRGNSGGNQLFTDYTYAETAKGWERTTTYPTGDDIVEASDLSGRVYKSEVIKSGKPTTHYHNYMGDSYLGRTSDWSSWYGGPSPDPMTFTKELDGFGRPKNWEVRGLTLTNGSPSNSDWADEYCSNNGYDPSRCSNPLLKIDVKRDVMGRLRGVNSRFGNPMTDGNNLLDDDYHVHRFHGYNYTKRGYLDKSWKRELQVGAGNAVSLNSLIPNSISNNDVDNLGGSEGAEPWKWDRNPDVGSLKTIENLDSNEVRFESSRHPGHRMVEMAVDDTSYIVEHDPAGRTTKSLDHDLSYNADGSLAVVFKPGTNDPLEIYLYDASGRLSYVFNADTKKTDALYYDGTNMVLSLDKGGNENWATFYNSRWPASRIS